MEDWILEREFVLWLGTRAEEAPAATERARKPNGEATSNGRPATRRRIRDAELGEELYELR